MSPRLWKFLPAIAAGVLSLALSATVIAQKPGMGGPPGGQGGPRPIPTPAPQQKMTIQKTKPQYANFYMQTNIGSFRMMEYNDGHQPEGHFEMTFNGTVLIDTTRSFKHNRQELTTQVTTTGNVRKEMDFHGRVLYHGVGKIVVDGGWHALEFFGTDMNAKFNGYGVVRLTGEFDKNLNTGYYWYDDGQKLDWGTSGNQPTIPKLSYGGTEKPTYKFNSKG